MGDAELREPVQRDERSRLAGEGGEDRRGSLHEMVAGGEQLDRDVVAAERPQGEHGLERGDAAAGDEHAERWRRWRAGWGHTRTVGALAPPAIRVRSAAMLRVSRTCVPPFHRTRGAGRRPTVPP